MSRICWPRDKIQNDKENLASLLSFKSFCICAKNQMVNEWIKPLQNLKEHFSCKKFSCKLLEKMQLIFDRDNKPLRL